MATKRTRQTRTAKKKRVFTRNFIHQYSSHTHTLSTSLARVSALAGDSDDSDAPNTYDYTDSFIDDAEASEDCESTVTVALDGPMVLLVWCV